MAGWFDEQIKQRIKNDEDDFSEAFAAMSGVVMGKSVLRANATAERRTKDAINQILCYYNVKTVTIPDTIKDYHEQLEYSLRPTGIMRRDIKLTGKWYKDAIGAMLGYTKDGEIVAIIPKGFSGYEFTDYNTGEAVKVTSKTASMLEEDAICFYKSLPLQKISIFDLFIYIVKTLSVSDYVMFALAGLAVTLLGLLFPYANNILFSEAINGENISILFPISLLLMGVTVSTVLIKITKSLIMARIQTKMDIAVQSASMMRLLSMPVTFFKEYSAGELASRVSGMNGLCMMLTNTLMDTTIISLFAVIYIGQIAYYVPSLVFPATAITMITVLVTVISSLLQMHISNKKMKLYAKLDGLVFALISGVQKIKLAGAERRAFAKWAHQYAKVAKLQYDPPVFIIINTVISTAITLLGTIAIYYFAARKQVSVADYMTFNVAYGMVSGAFMGFASMALTVANINPTLNLVKPILATVPEISSGKKVMTKLSGNIELNNVSFHYSDGMPLVLDNISIKIKAGQYVAIVGKTGCGKTTLMRLLLGFEKPDKGAVYYDGKDISTIDLKSLRRKIGVVLQNGKLFSGDIFSNIVISAPWLTVEDAWEAARMAGIDKDIEDMPMGMHTYITEGNGGISGGQRQRFMIARAIAPKPKVLLFDEATSALDNVTQKIVSDSLDRLNCTRIVIAHRLSTIRQCDRIIVLDNGHIIEDGNYEELVKKCGFFAELVARQRLDISLS